MQIRFRSINPSYNIIKLLCMKYIHYRIFFRLKDGRFGYMQLVSWFNKYFQNLYCIIFRDNVTICIVLSRLFLLFTAVTLKNLAISSDWSLQFCTWKKFHQLNHILCQIRQGGLILQSNSSEQEIKSRKRFAYCYIVPKYYAIQILKILVKSCFILYTIFKV